MNMITELNNLKYDLLRLKAQLLLAKGNWGHGGRPGSVGGSSSKGSGGGGSGGSMRVQTDQGNTIDIDIDNAIESTIKDIKQDEDAKNSTMTNKRIWNLIDTNNNVFKISPSEKAEKDTVGRSALNQKMYEGVLKKLGREIPKEK